MEQFDANGNEVSGIGGQGEPVAITAGWLRASQRKLDPQRSTDYHPFHNHDQIQKLTPGQLVPVDYGSPFARGVPIDKLAVLSYICQVSLAVLA